MQSPPIVAYSVPEAIAMLGVGRDKFYQLIRSKRLRAFKLDRKTLILADDLRAFLESLLVIEDAPPVIVRRRNGA